ncbi:glycoside hydrolase family 3 [Candidatus Marinamargulisbacteria bacterium SCGC AG-439-L15]|nr:glycoside hydrolase family 3 [Candidatus Marinamargulisbacteria bacterium SCGC AG-439-L15]
MNPFKYVLCLSAILVPILSYGAIPAAWETPLETKIGQMICTGFQGTNSTQKPIKELKKLISQKKIGCVILYNHNIQNPEQTQALIRTLKESSPTDYPLLVAIDQEGGYVQRLKTKKGFPKFPSAKKIGHAYSYNQARRNYERMAELLKELGVNLNLGVVLDLEKNKDSVLISKKERSFSDTPFVVSHYAKIMIDAHKTQNVLTAIKHYPGHGSTAVDTHDKLANISKTWSQQELIPYKSLISADKVDIIMTSHVLNRNVDPKLPASLSQKHIQGQLRQTLNYQGVVISDDLQMNAIRKNYSLDTILTNSINAGTDILLFGSIGKENSTLPLTISNKIKVAIENGSILPEHIDLAFIRIMRLKQRL